MKLYIDIKKLTDSPYNGSEDFPFVFDLAAINELLSDIKNGNPTCYLVSGYRGAGKSSFVRKLEGSIPKDKNILFVHTSFARYHSHSYLLRKLIRGLYQSLQAEPNASIRIHLTTTEVAAKEAKENRISNILGELYEKTFHEVSRNSYKMFASEKENKTTLNAVLTVGFGTALLLSLSNFIYPWLLPNQLPTILTSVASAFGLINSFLSISSSITTIDRDQEEFERKTLYDDEISGYHFNNMLSGLSKKGIKVVFVLDELDKVKEEEADNLLNEMKPYLVSGAASFIVVAGQELYYKYERAATKDDAVLSTLFSRTIHVPLLTTADFSSIFKKLIDSKRHPKELPDNDYQLFLDHLIFKSKRTPRKFMNLIREKIYWEADAGYLEINEKEEYKQSSAILQAIKKIDDSEISVNFDGGARDYLSMQLFLMGERILKMSWKGCMFSKEDIIM